MTQAIAEDSNQFDRDEATLRLEADKRDPSSGVIGTVLNRIKSTLAERDRHLRNQEDIRLLPLVANTILFVAMVEMIDLQLLWQYRVEILVMFLATFEYLEMFKALEWATSCFPPSPTPVR